MDPGRCLCHVAENQQEMLTVTQKSLTHPKTRNSRWSLELEQSLGHLQTQNCLLADCRIFKRKMWSLQTARTWTGGSISQCNKEKAFVWDSWYRLVTFLVNYWSCRQLTQQDINMAISLVTAWGRQGGQEEIEQMWNHIIETPSAL